MDYNNELTPNSSEQSEVSELGQKGADTAELKFPKKKSQLGYGANLVLLLDYDIDKILKEFDPADLDDKNSSVGTKEMHVTILPNIDQDMLKNQQALNFIESQVKASGILSNPLTLGKVSTFDMSSRDIIYLNIIEGGDKLKDLHGKLEKTIPNQPYFKDFKLHVTLARLKDGEAYKKYLPKLKNFVITVQPKSCVLLNKDGQAVMTIQD